jgi:hypothetical protein
LDLAEQLSKTDPRLFGVSAGFSLFAANIRIRKFEDYDVVKLWDAGMRRWRNWAEIVEEAEELPEQQVIAPTQAAKKRRREGDPVGDEVVTQKKKSQLRHRRPL